MSVNSAASCVPQVIVSSSGRRNGEVLFVDFVGLKCNSITKRTRRRIGACNRIAPVFLRRNSGTRAVLDLDRVGRGEGGEAKDVKREVV